MKKNTAAMVRIGAVVAGFLLGFYTSPAQTAADYHNRADTALQSFLLKFFNGGQQYLKHNYPDNGQLTGYWTYANGWDAVLDGVERTGGQQYKGLIETLYLGQNDRGWLADYYDDEAWMCLALIRAFDLTGDSKFLAKAQELLDDIQGGWDSTCCGPNPGGIWWDKAHTQKATASNAGAALAAARLYIRTADPFYLSFAQTVYSYWLANMVHTATWQVADHIDPNGSIIWWRFTYNEGLMIGASVELYEATGAASYLANAHNIANFMVNNEIVPTQFGNVLYDGSNSGCGGDCHQFKGPAYRYLHRLYHLDTSKTQYFNVLKASADALWNLARNPSLNIFSVDWAGPSMSTATQPADNAACMALSRFAQTAGAYPGSGIPAGRYEAENSVLHRIGLEANGAGFTGWGYLAGWNGDGQWVDFNISNAVAGIRTLNFRYAAGAGDAYRQIYINGQTVAPAKLFPGTGSWGNYNTASVSHNFPAGPSTVSVIFSSGLGSANWLNLDSLEVTQGAPIEQILQQNQSGASKMDIKLGQKGAQSFRHGVAGGQSYVITKVVLHLSRESQAPNANLSFSIGTGINAGTIVGSAATIAPAQITDASAGVTFSTLQIVYPTPVGPLSAGTTYHLNMACEASNGKAVYTQYSGNNAYSNGAYYKGGGNDGKDMWFEVWGRPQ